MSDETFQTKMVCALARGKTLADVAPGTIFTHKCASCGAAVCVAPSSQRVLAAQPGIEIICLVCYAEDARDDDIVSIAPGTAEEVNDFFRKRDAS
jgi:hypothetical protein